MKKLGQLAPEDRKEIGQKVNKAKEEILQFFEKTLRDARNLIGSWMGYPQQLLNSVCSSIQRLSMDRSIIDL
jgi:hypothetical protein